MKHDICFCSTFIYYPNLCMQTAKKITGTHGCAGPSKPLLCSMLYQNLLKWLFVFSTGLDKQKF